MEQQHASQPDRGDSEEPSDHCEIFAAGVHGGRREGGGYGNPSDRRFRVPLGISNERIGIVAMSVVKKADTREQGERCPSAVGQQSLA